ncbi:hypothetical protein LUCX_2 [Xanthomonas phage vB_XciM_LucasX]|nr:hypothetical protein LUCX_2 [Xanthomonas phage vB_XciM_LucasX]
MSFRIKDKVWAQQSFLLPESALDDVDKRRRVLTSAAYKFTDTTIGGNFAINAPPQFTRFADIRIGGSDRYSRGATNAQNSSGALRWMMSTGRFMTADPTQKAFTTPSAGMGRFYSEGIDDYGQDLVMRFGVPEYNSLTQFFGNFYSTDAALMARTGRTSTLFHTTGKAVGFLLALPLQPIILGGQVIKFLGNWPASKYYYLKPAMYPYWNAVNTIANGIAVNLGLIPQALTEAQRKVMGQDANYMGSQQDMLQEYARVMPDVFFTDNGQAAGMDVYAIATRAQRLANKFNTELQNQLDTLDDVRNLDTALVQFRDRMFHQGGLKAIPSEGIDAYRDRYYLSSSRNQSSGVDTYVNLDGTPSSTATGDGSNASPDGTTGSAGTSATTDDGASKQIDVESAGTREQYNMASGSWVGSLREMFEGERRDGSQFVTFRADYTGSTGESFSNATEESQIAQKFNSTSSSARSARFDLANGNFTDVPVIGDLVGGVINAAKDLVNGTLEGVHMSGLLALAGNAFVDIPKTWSGSTANLPRAEYTIKLRSPYGTRMSRMMNLYIPLSMLLAGALPLSTGKRSYTAPFICEAYCRGRHAIRLGMIDQMSITRGVGNMGWSQQGDALGIDVTFSIVDMSSIMHLPIQTNFGATDKAIQAAADVLNVSEFASYFQKGTYDDDNSFTDYLAVLGSLSWQDMVYANRRWRLARYRQMQAWNSWKSPARVASWMGDTTLGRLINAISTETDRPD